MVQHGKGNEHSYTELVSYFETKRLLGGQVSSSLNSIHRIVLGRIGNSCHAGLDCVFTPTNLLVLFFLEVAPSHVALQDCSFPWH